MRGLLFLALFAVTTSYAQSRKLSAESSIAGVTVFASGAQILRTANISFFLVAAKLLEATPSTLPSRP